MDLLTPEEQSGLTINCKLREGIGNFRKMFKENRCKWDIIHGILKAVQEKNGKIKKTRIMQKAYMDWNNFKRYHSLLLKRNILSLDKESNCYSITPIGVKLLDETEELIEILT